MAITVIFLPDSELRTPLVRAIRRAKKSVDMVYFYWKTKYATGGTPPMDVLNAAREAAAKEEVTVRALLGYGADVPSIQYLNYLTGETLAAAGVEVRLAPTGRTTHVKMTIVDSGQVFIGSHNVTKGALSENAEATALVKDTAFASVAKDYFNQRWQEGTPLAQVPPPPPPDEQQEGVTGYYPPPVAPALTVTAESSNSQSSPTGAAILEWTAGSPSFFSRYEIYKDSVAGVSDESPLLIALPYVGVTRYVDADRNPALATYYRLYLVNTAGVSDASDEVLLPPTRVPQVTLTSVVNENDALVCSFSVDTREGIASFAALASPNGNLSNPTKGPEFDSTVSQAWAHPVANAGDTVYVAVAAYADGIEIARSNIVQTVYQPVTAPPPTLTATQLTSVTQTGAMGINVNWTYPTEATDFSRFEVQQRTNGTWQTIATIMDGTARSWDGAPNVMDAAHPIRVVVFSTGGQSAASNEMAITLLPSLAAPVLTTLYRVGAMGLHVEWTHSGVTDFARFELQQRQTDAVTWAAFATITDPTARSWEVDFVQYRDGTHPVRVVVFDTYGQSAASNEVFIGGPDAPHIESVETASGTTVRVQWTWSGQDFQSYIVQQQDAQLTWHDLAQIFAQSTMQWTGAPTVMQVGRPFRVVVNAGTPSPVAVNSNEVSLVAGPPPAPVLGVITPAPLPTVHVPWTWAGALNFASFVIQQRNGTMVWQDLATITNPATVDWTGQMLPTGQAWPFRLVVYLTTGESATSAEGYVTQT